MLHTAIKVNRDTLIGISLLRVSDNADGTRDYKGRAFIHASGKDIPFKVKGHKPSIGDGALRLMRDAISAVLEQIEESKQSG